MSKIPGNTEKGFHIEGDKAGWQWSACFSIGSVGKEVYNG